jgi:hypothetical protein
VRTHQRQVEASLLALLTREQRDALACLPVVMGGLGVQLKQHAARPVVMYAYGALRSTPVADKVLRYIRRNVHDVLSLQRYLVK